MWAPAPMSTGSVKVGGGGADRPIWTLWLHKFMATVVASQIATQPRSGEPFRVLPVVTLPGLEAWRRGLVISPPRGVTARWGHTTLLTALWWVRTAPLRE